MSESLPEGMANLSCAREFGIDSQYRRCCIYLVIGGWVVFAAMFVVAAQMGQPPDAARIAFGVALFVVAKVGNIPFHVLARAILPFLGPLLIVQVIVTYWPSLILFLPRLFFD